MSETSSHLRSEHIESQPYQAVNVQTLPSTAVQSLPPTVAHTQQYQQHQHQQQHQQQQQQQQQQRSISQAERSERSGRSGGRQPVQRRSSTSSSASSLDRDPRPAVTGGGSGGAAAHQLTTSADQHYSNGAGYSQNGNFSNAGASGSQGSFASGERRHGRFRRQVIRLPDQAQGHVRQVRRRLPTPEPDTIERVYIQRTAGEVVEEITEVPTTPPPRVQERTVVEPAGPPQVIKRVIRVPPRGGAAFAGQYQQGPTGANFQGSSVSVGGESFAQTSQGSGPVTYQQQQHQYGGPTSAFGQTAVGAAPSVPFQGQPGAFSFSINTGAGFPSQSVQPPIGCHPAFCFYV